jgi:type VI secretion system protein ImpL
VCHCFTILVAEKAGKHSNYNPENINDRKDNQSIEKGHFLQLSVTKGSATATRSTYGLLWFRKIRILLITGTAAEVEQLTPA